VTQPFTVDSFGGLDVISSPFKVGASGAVEMLNVDLDVRGMLRARDGYANHTSGAAANTYRALYFAEPNTLLGIRGGLAINCVIEAITSAGAVATSTTGSAGVPSLSGFASIGTPSSTTTYIACSGFGADVKTWDGSAFATASFTGSGTKPTTTDLLAAWDNRLVATDISALSAKVKFSNKGDATVFDTDDFEIPDAGDGLQNRALVAFGTYLLLFRDTKMFSFYDVSVDTDGGAVFNYNRFSHGNIGSWLGYAVANDAVYVLTTKGLYGTTGSAPLALVSEMPSAIFPDVLAPIPSASTDYAYAPGAAIDRRLFFAVPANGSSTLNRTLVYDQVTQSWLIWNIAAQSFAVTTYSVDAGDRLMFGLPSFHIGTLADVTTDAGTAITWSYKSGKYPVTSDPGRVAVTSDTSLLGATVNGGAISLSLNTSAFTAIGGTVSPGFSPAELEAWLGKDQEGKWYQHVLSATESGRVSRVTHWVSSVKPAGVE
jgi:hypothetical protein